MGYSVLYTLPENDTLLASPVVKWCNEQGWRHIIDWRWFWNPPSDPRTLQFHFEDPQHAHWFILRWGGTITGEI